MRKAFYAGLCLCLCLLLAACATEPSAPEAPEPPQEITVPAPTPVPEPTPEPEPAPEPQPAAPAQPVLPAEPDYYFMGALYGLGDYPPFSELLDQPDALDRLKQFYTGLSGMVDRVEYHTQSLEYIGAYSGDAKFTSNGAPNGMGDDGQLHTALKTLMVGRAEADAFDGVLESGRGFAEDDFTVRSAEDSIPVLLGHDYCGLYQLGDELTLSLHRQPLRFTVAGFLKSNAAFRFDREIPLDQHIIVPFYDIAYEPADAGNRYYQQVYYTQKCEGFVAIDPAADAEQMFRDVEALAQKYDLLYAVTPVKCRISEENAAI